MKNKVMSKALSWVLAAAMTVTMSGAIPAMATSVSADTTTTSTTVYYSQLSGTNRYGTAAAIADQFYKQGATSTKAVLVTGQKFADALSASGLAGLEKAPLLLTKATVLPDETKKVITDHKITSVTIIGSTDSVSADVEKALTAAGVTSISRVYGKNRTATAEQVEAQIVKEGGNADTVVVATGAKAADALSIAPVLYKNGWPMLLASSGTLSDASLAIAKAAKTVYILGDEKSVSAATMTAIGTQAKRISGKNRYLTSVEIAKTFAGKSYDGTAYAAGEGDNFADALAGGMLMGQKGAPIILINGQGTTGAGFDFTGTTVSKDTTCKAITFLGSEKTVLPAASAKILSYWTKSVKTTDYDSTIAADQKMTAVQAGTKTIKVTFASAIEDASKITVTKGKVGQTVATAVLSDDKKTATITLASNILAADYTVAYGDLTSTFTGVAAVLTSVKFLSNNLVMTNSTMTAGTVIVKAYNQFDEEVTLDANSWTATPSKGTPLTDYDSKTGILTINNTDGFTLNSSVAVTVIYAGNTKVASATLTVSSASYAKEITLGDLTTSDTKYTSARLTAANLKAGSYYLPVTAKDQYGNTLTSEQLDTMVSNGTIYVTPESSAIGTSAVVPTGSKGTPSTVFTADKKGNVMMSVIGNGTIYGAGIINVLSTSGVTVAKTITVLENEKIDTLTVTPDGSFRAKKGTSVTISAMNQYAEAVDLYALYAAGKLTVNTNVLTLDGSTTVTLTNATFTVTPDASKKTVTIKMIPNAAGPVIVTYLTASGKAGAATYTAAAAATIDNIKGVDSSKVNTSLTTGTTADLGTSGNVLFLDTDGDTVATGVTYSKAAPTTGSTGYFYTVAKAIATAKATTFDETSGKITGASVSENTTEDYIITLYKDTEAIATKSVTISVIPTAGLTYTLEADKIMYTGVANTMLLKLKAKDANGNDVSIDQSLMKHATVTSPAGITATVGSTGCTLANENTVETNGTVKEGAVSVIVETNSKTIPVVGTFKYSNANSVETAIIIKNSKNEIVTDNSISVDKAAADNAINGYTISFVDQYGNAATGTAQYVITNYKNASTDDDKTCATDASYSADKLILTLSKGAVKAGDTFNLTVSFGTLTRTIAVTEASV